MEPSTERLSIYKAARSIKKMDNSLYNALRSIYDDSIFVLEIGQLWPELPLLANLRCGLWYTPNNKFHSTCYFKSTDGHYSNWSFNTSRLNLHVAQIAAHRGGCMIIDSTRKGKRFPDSMSKTIPIWTCVLNRAIRNYWMRHSFVGDSAEKEFKEPIDATGDISGNGSCWDCSLHFPLWVSDTEKALVENRLEGWTNDLETCGADIASLALFLKKPLRPLWISQRTVIWLNEVPEYDSWDFTPIILVSASSSTCNFHQRTTSEFSWTYIAGAGDDEESWARGLSPELFWKHAYDIISSGPNLCNQKVADIVEKNRVYQSQRGEVTPQVSIKQKAVQSCDELSCSSILLVNGDDVDASTSDSSVSWLGSTNLAVGASQSGTIISTPSLLTEFCQI
ncbi:RNA processing factor [Lithospermum erythrorhizon]|uniref:RNA processing factor n=1 Tax=Lithospermum erythrorhizon TaxID=34254 RepID=A0AAV3P6I3_LITER